MADTHWVDASIPSARRLSTNRKIDHIDPVYGALENDASPSYGKGADFSSWQAPGSTARMRGFTHDLMGLIGSRLVSIGQFRT